MDQTQRALLSTLYERWYGVLHRYAQWAVGDALLAEEIVQETFLAAVPKIEELAAGEHPERWLIQTAKYKALHVLREQARQRAKNTVLEESLAAPDQLGQWEDREYAGQLWEKAAALLSPEEVGAASDGGTGKAGAPGGGRAIGALAVVLPETNAAYSKKAAGPEEKAGRGDTMKRPEETMRALSQEELEQMLQNDFLMAVVL